MLWVTLIERNWQLTAQMAPRIEDATTRVSKLRNKIYLVVATVQYLAWGTLTQKPPLAVAVSHARGSAQAMEPHAMLPKLRNDNSLL